MRETCALLDLLAIVRPSRNRLRRLLRGENVAASIGIMHGQSTARAGLAKQTPVWAVLVAFHRGRRLTFEGRRYSKLIVCHGHESIK
jgi:hypothetical protein